MREYPEHLVGRNGREIGQPGVDQRGVTQGRPHVGGGFRAVLDGGKLEEPTAFVLGLRPFQLLLGWGIHVSQFFQDRLGQIPGVHPIRWPCAQGSDGG